jgi:hypothetical protein
MEWRRMDEAGSGRADAIPLASAPPSSIRRAGGTRSYDGPARHGPVHSSGSPRRMTSARTTASLWSLSRAE